MSCALNAGRLEPCKDSVAGIRAVLFLNYDGDLTDTLTIVDEEITANSALTTAYRYELKGANSFDEANENSRENGTSFWNGTGTFAFKKQSLASQKEMRLLSYGRPHIILEYYNGDYRLIGLKNGAECAVNTASGAAMGDFIGYNVTATTTEATMGLYVASSLIGHASAGFAITEGT